MSENAPTDDTERDRAYRAPTVDLSDDQLEELERLRAAMGFIPKQAAKPKVIDDRYQVVRTLGRGGMGVVYLVDDLELKTQVALKVIRDSYLRRVSGAPARLRQEARQMAKLRGHPNVVGLYEAGMDGTSAYFTMQYVEGTDLRDWLLAKERSQVEVLRAYLDAARGLRAAHERGLVHRDFKPENVLVAADGTARVTDFGISKLVDGLVDELGDTLPGGARQTAPRGTVPYMPPEQMAGDRPDGRTDQFSFCIALWEGLAGELPYAWRSPKSQDRALRLPPAYADAVPRWLRKPLRKGMSAKRSDRFDSMDPLIEAIERGLARPAKRRRLTVGAAATLIAGALSAGLVFLLFWEPPEATCEPFAAAIEDSWDAPQRRKLIERGEKLDVDVSWAVAELDELTSAWTERALAACEGDQAPAKNDPRRRCLEGWLGPLDHAVELLVRRGDRDTLLRAPDLLTAIAPPANDFCVPTGRPDDPELADQVDGARTAAVAGHHRDAVALGEAAVERAESISGGSEYTAGQGHAHAALAEALMFSGDFKSAVDEYELAEAHAMGSNDLGLLAHARVLLAKSLAFMPEGEAERAEEHLDRALPLFHAGSFSDRDPLRGELWETRALIHDDDVEIATSNYARAIDLFEGADKPLLAARAILNRGASHRDSGQLEAAEADLRRAIEIYHREGVPASYPRLLGAQFNLALTMYDRAFEFDDQERFDEYATLSINLLEQIGRNAKSPTRRLTALAQACQVAADTDRHERILPLTEQARFELADATDIDQRTRDHVEVQIALARLQLDTPDSRAHVQTLLARGPDLETNLHWALARDFVEHLERRGACAEARMELGRITGLDELDDFVDWRSERPGGACE